MGKKFDAIYESIVTRYVVGGFLPGDIVKFKPDYQSSDCYKSMNSVMQSELKELIKSGLNIKVIQVGDNLSGASAGNQHKTPENVIVTIAGDHGGGRHFGGISVPAKILDIVSVGDNSPNIPDKFRREDNTTYKPEEYVEDPKNITRVTDKGNGKYAPTDIKLAGESTRFKVDNANMAMIYEEL